MLKVQGEPRRTVKWLLVGALVAQLVIVPWRVVFSIQTAEDWDRVERVVYSPILTLPKPEETKAQHPSFSSSEVALERLLAQLAVTVGLLLLWVFLSESKE